MKHRVYLLAMLLMVLPASLSACQMLPFGHKAPLPTATPHIVEVTPRPTYTPLPTYTPTITPTPANTPTPTITPTPVDPTTLFHTAHCPFDLPRSVEEGVDILCGYVQVPEDHANPTGKQIQLAVAVIPSLSPIPLPDPLVVEQGGPGGSTLLTFGPLMLRGFMDGFRAERDVVLVEQRGTLYSKPFLHCKYEEQLSIDTVGEALTPDEMMQREIDTAARCADRTRFDNVDLSNYDSVQNAADIALVVSALGYDQFNLYGVSYGTLLAQHVMRDYPDRLRSVILDAVVPIQLNWIDGIPANVDHSLRLLFESCADDPACSARYPDLEKTFFDTVDALNANPVMLPVADPDIGVEYEMRFTGDRLIDMTFGMLYITDLLPLMPTIIDAISRGDYTFVKLAAPGTIVDREFADNMYYAVVCSEQNGFAPSQQTTADIYPDLAQHFSQEDWPSLCAAWKVEPLPASAHQPVIASIPTLIFSGQYDPITPPAYGQTVAAGLTPVYRYTLPGFGHGAIGYSCPDSMMVAFLDDPTTAPDSSCIDRLGMTFSVPGRVGLELAPVRLDNPGIDTVAPAEWIQMQPGVWARLESAIDPTALIIDGYPSGQESVDLFLRHFAAAVHADADPEFVMDRELPGLSWKVYRFHIDAYPVLAALATDSRGVVASVMLITGSDGEALALTQSVLIPAIDAFSIDY